MSFVFNLVNRYQTETAITLLLLSYFGNGMFFCIFLSLLVYYYRKGKKAQSWKHYKGYNDYRVRI